MSDPKQIENELRDFLNKQKNLNKEDQLSYLKAIFAKHLELDSLTHRVTYRDYFIILSNAKNHFGNMKLPVKLTNKSLDSKEVTQLATLESFLMYLNQMHLLKKNVELDYTE